MSARYKLNTLIEFTGQFTRLYRRHSNQLIAATKLTGFFKRLPVSLSVQDLDPLLAGAVRGLLKLAVQCGAMRKRSDFEI